MSIGDATPDGLSDDPGMGMRLLVLEMTVAAIAARLPPGDFDEVVSMLVFVARSAEAARDIKDLPADTPRLADAGHFATEMLDRISRSRRSERSAGRH